MTESPILLIQHDTGQAVGATLIEDVPLDSLEAVDRLWRPALEEAIQSLRERGVPEKELPLHGHWRWNEKAKYARVFPLTYRFFGVRVDGEMQGLSMTAVSESADKQCRIESQKGKPMVYVDYIEAAPLEPTEACGVPTL